MIKNLIALETQEGVAWYDSLLLELEGRGWSHTPTPFCRLPSEAEGVVRPEVWRLSQDSAGLCVRFVTDATAISARWTLRRAEIAMDHMPATGVSGLDLYVRDNGRWRWLGVSRLPTYPHATAELTSHLSPDLREYLLYLPLYNGVEKLEIGLPVDAHLKRAGERSADNAKPICFYGTSIVQGGCVSRSGMAYPAILGRRLDRPVINLGFSGNGKAEPEMAHLLAQLDPILYVIDCVGNMAPESIVERMVHLLSKLRTTHPDTPIVFVEHIEFQDSPLQQKRFHLQSVLRKAQHQVCKLLASQGMKGLHFVPGDALFGDDYEATVDGTHPTDLGAKRTADVLEPVISRVLQLPSR